MSLSRALPSFALLGSALLAHAAPTVVDGDFEGSILSTSYEYRHAGSDWTYTGNSGLATGSMPWHDAAQSGSQYAFVQTSPAGVLTGSITGLTAGADYTLSFYLGSRAGYPIEPLSVLIGGSAIATGVAPTDDRTGTGWTRFSYAFTAPSASTTVGFAGLDQGGDFNTALDNVSVQAVPEPASLAALGLGALGLLRRRRRA